MLVLLFCCKFEEIKQHSFWLSAKFIHQPVYSFQINLQEQIKMKLILILIALIIAICDAQIIGVIQRDTRTRDERLTCSQCIVKI